MNYRLYLFGESGRTFTGEAFVADDDKRAISLALTIFSARGGEIGGYELWRDSVKIADDRSSANAIPRWAMAQARQGDVLDLENQMQTSFQWLKRIERLFAASSKLRDTRQRRHGKDTTGRPEPRNLKPNGS